MEYEEAVRAHERELETKQLEHKLAVEDDETQYKRGLEERTNDERLANERMRHREVIAEKLAGLKNTLGIYLEEILKVCRGKDLDYEKSRRDYRAQLGQEYIDNLNEQTKFDTDETIADDVRKRIEDLVDTKFPPIIDEEKDIPQLPKELRQLIREVLPASEPDLGEDS